MLISHLQIKVQLYRSSQTHHRLTYSQNILVNIQAHTVQRTQHIVAKIPGFRRKRLLQRSTQSGCSAFKIVGGKCSSVDAKIF
jgi:hypothetical protein